ncbi:hypothetical protein PCAR4_830036 [Paraburkholderia caribensis]|nr:hypothetical protein PCAR4_830036 [Paraburkholderia caribensis]
MRQCVRERLSTHKVGYEQYPSQGGPKSHEKPFFAARVSPQFRPETSGFQQRGCLDRRPA